MKKLCIIFLFLISIPAQAFEDCVITTNGKLTDINIEDNQIIDVCPLITIGNDRNTLIVHPLKAGSTRFCVLKNNKNIVMFNVKVTQNKTTIDEVEGFDILPLDVPEGVFELDEPPEVNHG